VRDDVARFHGTTIAEPEAGHLTVLEASCDPAAHRTTTDGFCCGVCKASV